jgi:outer membrane protein assembly factor BamB
MCSPATGSAAAETAADHDGLKGTIVAAGFGYQAGDASTITVKVYDAASGAVLSDETYELNVKEEGNKRVHPVQERIFAGGVGLGATDLSNFVLRVYDARTGAFQWEGLLNLMPRDRTAAGQTISSVTPRRATVRRVLVDEPAFRQPSFLIRALDATTGRPVWQDEFSADGAGFGRVERVADRLMRRAGSPSDTAPTFDFRIRMFDRSGRSILWEDRVTQDEPEEETDEAADDHAHMLPPWPLVPQQDGAPESL